MSQIEVRNAEGQAVEPIELSSDVYGIEPNIPVIHRTVVAIQANMRQDTHAVKNRHDVSGGGRKPYRQKGTGRARQGSTRAGQWTGGGVIFGPQANANHTKRVNNKEVKLAMRSALSGKLADNELFVVDELSFEKPSTKAGKAVIEALGLAGKRVTVVVEDDAVNAYLSLRNLPKVTVIGVSDADALFLVDNAALVMTAAVAKRLEEVLI